MNLLTDPLLSVTTREGKTKIHLPALLAALGEDQVEALDGLQRHQMDPFHVFLCQVAATVLARGEQNEPVQSADFWCEGLRQLAGGDDDSAWTLVVDDPTRPAFLQPPTPTESDFRGAYKLKASTPDELDMLPTAKDHDLKMSRMLARNPEDWLYALLSLQNMSGFFGAGNYGIVRMNGGFGSRPFVSLITSMRPGPRFVRDVRVLLEQRPSLLAPPWPYRDDGVALTWVPVWDRKTSLALAELDPFFIEICRAVRLRQNGDTISAWGSSSKAARLQASETKGNVGDAWIPIAQKTAGALTVSGAGLTPGLLRELIFEDGYKAAPMQRIHDFDRDARNTRIVVSVLVRGQGTTEGYHSEQISVPANARRLFARRGDAYTRLGEFSKNLLDDARKMQNSVMGPALYSLYEGGPEQVDFDKREVSAWVDKNRRHFALAWQQHYFDQLWEAVEGDHDTIRRQWVRLLRDQALKILHRAMDSAPRRSNRRLRAISLAEGYFRGSLYKHFGHLLKEETSDAG